MAVYSHEITILPYRIILWHQIIPYQCHILPGKSDRVSWFVANISIFSIILCDMSVDVWYSGDICCIFSVITYSVIEQVDSQFLFLSIPSISDYYQFIIEYHSSQIYLHIMSVMDKMKKEEAITNAVGNDSSIVKNIVSEALMCPEVSLA